jgi:hypothetical protein
MHSAACQPSVSVLQSVGSLHQQLEGSPSPLDPIPPLPFTSNLIPTTSAQERQVVSELQCILEQSVQQNQQQEKAVSEMMNATDILSIKPEISYNNMNIELSQNSITTSSVPLDLQFPTDNIQTVRSVGFSDHTIPSSQYSSVQSLSCMAPEVTSQLLNRSANSVELTAEQKLLTELLPGSQALVPTTPNTIHHSLGGSTAIMAMSSTASNDMVMTLSGNVPAMSVMDCLGSGIIKTEPQTLTTTNVTGNANTIQVNGMAVGSTQSQPSAVASVTMNNGSYMVGDLQGHQGTITNAITQMSDNELINYINPSCFDQSLM